VEAGAVVAEIVASELLIVTAVEGPGWAVARIAVASERPRPLKMRRAAAMASGPAAAMAAVVAGAIP
jgi:hypothetical protein